MTPFELTPGEIDTWNVSMDGVDYDTLAKRLFLTYSGVKYRMNAIYGKTGCINRAELVAMQNREYGGKWLEGGADRVNKAIIPHYPAADKAA